MLVHDFNFERKEVEKRIDIDEETCEKDRNALADENRNGVSGILDTLLPRTVVRVAMASETAYSHDLAEPVVALIKRVQSNDEFSKEKLQSISSVGETRLRDSAWKKDADGLLRYQGCVYVPNDTALRAEIMRINHDDPQGGHFREKRTLESINRRYYWHGIAKDVKKHVKECDQCQRIAVHRHKPYGELEPLPVPRNPMDWISMDFITGLPPARWQGQVYDAILVVVDLCSKFALYIPTRKDIDASELAELFFERVVALLGNARNIVSDRGTIFTGTF